LPTSKSVGTAWIRQRTFEESHACGVRQSVDIA
jgi:hypothetical protein